MTDWEQIILNDLCKLDPNDPADREPGQPKPRRPRKIRTDNDLNVRALMRPEEGTMKRDSKRRPRRNRARGDTFTGNYGRAVYQEPEKLQAQHDKMPQPQWTPGQGESNLWVTGTDKRGHSEGHRVV